MVSRRLAHLLIASLLAMLAVLPAAAAKNVVHTTIPIDQMVTFPLGPEAQCFGVPEGTGINVHFTGELKLTFFVSGPNDGRVHERAKLAFTFTVPSTGASGSGSNKFNNKFGDGSFVSMNVVHVSGTLPDGTSYRATFHFHTVVKDGEVKVDIAKTNCEKL
ncbi:MAG: hypothetical protein AVDCRST_MAG93-9524 [uncultured Chloroflexia bacterium]|uniref:Uncharacterized protein n=1 Tax=uncultured Chloroflexia bacterium TaxID=1672391 RepID=A0A6J4NN15_9CHLR|nr:MAG: hypothetical protein AVDCRST_MAG93-9524 [uncultured Chloroflexia bacterium]